MDESVRIKETINNADLGVKRFTQAIGKRVFKCEDLTYQIISQFGQTVSYRIASHTAIFIRCISLLHNSANHHIIRATLHASPGVITLIMTFVTIFKIITWVARIIAVVKIVGTLWRINQAILSLWPQYKLWWDNMMNKISELSAGLGWGVDGILHFVNAVNIGVNLSGRLMGKEWSILQVDAMEKSIEMGVKISRIFDKLAVNPSQFLDDIWKIEQYKSGDNVRSWWWTTSQWIQTGLDIGQQAADGVSSMIGELSSIQENMPEVVRKNIPESIWIRLNQADYVLQYNVLPAINGIQRHLQTMNALMDSISGRGSELANKLAHPGDVLLGVDDLPDYVKKYQEGLIDDVTSREFEFWTNEERTEIQGGLDDFDRIDRLMKAPTSEPPLLTLEVLPGRTIRGITAEPHETWFPGGYNDPR